MGMTHYFIVKNQIEKIISYLEPLLPFANSHMVDYFSKSSFNTVLSEDLKTEVIRAGCENVIDIILNNKNSYETPVLNKYIDKTKSLRLYNLTDVCITRNGLNEKLIEWGCQDMSTLKLEMFVSPKKSHEVEILSKIIAAISYVNKTTHLVDLGDGKGYLSSMIALHHQIPVLGIDASVTNTNSAVKRARKLEKNWKSIVKTSTQTSCISNNLYKQVTQFVTEKTNFQQLIDDVFLVKDSLCSIVGLHTCGNLGSTSVKIFNNNKNVKTLCNVSCCYHLLSEEFEFDLNCSDNPGFPLSSYLKNRNFKLGRTARMLSSQSIDGILSKKELPNKTLLYRAIFEMLLEKYKGNIIKKEVGKIKKELKSFNDYAKYSLKKIDAQVVISEEELNELFNKYKCFEAELNVFYLLRCMLAPVVESLILLDRLLFLHENEHTSAFLMQLFDPVMSPRCYGLVAFKNM